MDDMKVMMQNELRQALAELMLLSHLLLLHLLLIHLSWMLHPLTMTTLGGNF